MTDESISVSVAVTHDVPLKHRMCYQDLQIPDANPVSHPY